MAEVMVTEITIMVFIEITGLTIMVTITIAGHDIIVTRGDIITIETMTIIDILIKIKAKETTAEPIQITEIEAEVGVAEDGEMYFMDCKI